MHRVFLGLTRPANIFGVPIVPFIAMALFCFVFAMWTTPPVGFIGIPIWFVMNRMARRDDFVFRQIGLFIQFALPMNMNKKLWSDCFSFSLTTFDQPQLRLGSSKSRISNRQLLQTN